MMKLIVESQRRLVENWKIHQTLGLEEKKNYFELHCMTAWVDHRRTLELHRKVLEACRKVWVACRKASDDCRIALFLKLYFLQTALVSTLWVAIHLGSGVPVYMDQGIEFWESFEEVELRRRIEVLHKQIGNGLLALLLPEHRDTWELQIEQ